MLLQTAIAGVYFSDNIAVTWIFLEATTLCAAGIIYHRRTAQTLEATLEIHLRLLDRHRHGLSGHPAALLGRRRGSLSYGALAERLRTGNPLYLKIAFLLILSGYSCKMEIFPLYTIGVDANFAAPSPASALISTGLVNAGFLAIFRVYRLMAETDIFGWVRSVLLIVGLLSLAIGALFLRRTNNYKRFLSYSTVENMGIVAIGLGIGGIGVWAALSTRCATRSSRVRSFCRWRSYVRSTTATASTGWATTSRSQPVGAVGLLLGTVVVLAFPALAALSVGADGLPRHLRRRQVVAGPGHAAAALHRGLLHLRTHHQALLPAQSGRTAPLAGRPGALVVGTRPADRRHGAGTVAARPVPRTDYRNRNPLKA